MSTPPKASGIRLKVVKLIRCSFDSDPAGMEDTEGSKRIKYGITKGIRPIDQPSGRYWVEIDVTVTGLAKDAEAWNCRTVFGAEFQVQPEHPDSFDGLLRNNAPSMLYGFAREHVFDLCRRAGFSGPILPPLDFMSPVESAEGGEDSSE